MTMLKWRQISSSYFDAQGSRAVGGTYWIHGLKGGGFVVSRRDKHRHRGRYNIGEVVTYEEAVALAQAHHDEQLTAFAQWQEGRHGA